MSITYGNRTVANAKFQAIYGAMAAGAYLLRFVFDFDVSPWPEGEARPLASVESATVYLSSNGPGLCLGSATPETAAPFRTGFGGLRGVLYELLVTPAGMEAIESARDGASIIFQARIVVRLTATNDFHVSTQDVVCRVSQSDWLEVLQGCGYRKSLLIEIAIPDAGAGQEAHAAHHLEKARTHMLRGHYADAVGACRLALEQWTESRNEVGLLASAKERQRSDPRMLTELQRELLLRQAVVNYAHLAHHASDSMAPAHFDRQSTTMLIGITAAILGRH